MCAPKAPAPSAVAQADTQGKMIGQNTPYGTLTYSQDGTFADGQPKYTATTSLSPVQQQLLATTQGTQQNLANLAKEQSGRLSSLFNAPLDFSAQQGYLNDLTAQNLNPQWDRLDQQNQTDLTNRGIRPGSAAYGQQRDEFLKSRSGAFNNANLNNYNSALQSQLALRQAPINELLALAGQGQVQQPSFVNTPQTDTAGIYQQGYANQMAGYQQGQSTLGGLFSAGASLIPLLSDRRAKRDIKRIGKTDTGIPIYQFRYKHGGPVQIGYMAQDLLVTNPEAVSVGPDGLFRVDYGQVA